MIINNKLLKSKFFFLYILFYNFISKIIFGLTLRWSNMVNDGLTLLNITIYV